MTTEKKEIRPQPMPLYYGPLEDEIDLLGLWQVLVKRWRLIFSVSVLSVVIASVFYLSVTRVYESRLILYPTYEEQVGFLGVSSGDVLFNVFMQHLGSDSDRRQVFDSMQLIDIFSDKGSEDVNEALVFSDFNQRLKLKGANKSLKSTEMTLSFEGSDLALNTDILNRLVGIARDNTKNELIFKINSKREELTNNIEQLIKGIPVQAITLLHQDEKSRIIKEQKIIENKIKHMKIQGLLEREKRIILLSEHAVMARELGLIDGSIDRDLIRGLASANTAHSDGVLFSDPHYLRGERALLIEIALLKKRKLDDAFIIGLSRLESDLLYNKRVMDQLYAEDAAEEVRAHEVELRAHEVELRANEVELRANEVELEKLSNLNVQIPSILVKGPVISEKGLALKSLLVLGGSLGLMLGIFAAFFFNILENNRKEEGAEA